MEQGEVESVRGCQEVKFGRRKRAKVESDNMPWLAHQGEDRGTRNKTRRNHREIRAHMHKDKASVETSQNLINLGRSEMTKMR